MPLGNIDSGVLIEDIIDGMLDWVRVIDCDDNILFMNKSMTDALGPIPSKGIKCYEKIGLSSPCANCVSRKAVFDEKSHVKEEVIRGRIYSVMSSPMKDNNGNINAVVEVLRDITLEKEMQKKILEQNEKLQDDLNIAKRLQCSLLPKELPEDKIDFSYIYKSCESIGGDFLDIFRIDDKHIGMYIADVSGHGVSASMLTVFLRSSIDKTLLSPAKALESLYNEYNNSNLDQDLYITLFYCILDIQSNTLTYSNAGLNVAPVILNKNKFSLLRTPGIPICNWLDKPDYTEKSVSLEKGDRIFLYTDGLIEIRNSNNELYGEERLLSFLMNVDSEPNSILNGIWNSVMDFSGIRDTGKISDDITMALLRIK